MSKWISVKDRFPNYRQLVLFIANNEMISGRFTYDDEEKGCFDDILYNECFYAPDVTHWMPLPEPPI